ncbi:type IV toxin-antitoxin system AbiEi family antitoxin domain-containing protein [Gracilimonas sediminicola]|uniref:type IV toxin-antitoxin system AbiEi family antitoxin domain-containing protein n=1 Tax=Gracilimonas sediminicola TaxID=2952158 RepID=UPI001AFFB1BF|nr:type IV toxin-antitoxin system AbiEi family antitoxin [Balneola sp.]
MNKINQILQVWPEKTVITTEWLREKGVSRQLADSYKKSGWLESFGMGAYKRPHERITWAGALYALQELGGFSIHVGGKSALEFIGLAHFIRLGKNEKILLWKKPSEKLPRWFSKRKWKSDMIIRSANLFGIENKLIKMEIDGVKLNVSSPEQAILEYLYDLPKREGWDEANYLMEGLMTLRPNVVQMLLADCNSIKVKQLFLYLAEKYDHNWLKRLDVSEIDLGKGKRQVIKGGIFNKKYKITIPEVERED